MAPQFDGKMALMSLQTHVTTRKKSLQKKCQCRGASLQKLNNGWPKSEEEQVTKFQRRRKCNEDSKEKNGKGDGDERKAEVRCADARRADER